MKDQKNDAMNAVLSQSTLTVDPKQTVTDQERDILYQRYLLQKMYLLKSIRYKSEGDKGDGRIRMEFVTHIAFSDFEELYLEDFNGNNCIPDEAKPFLFKNDISGDSIPLRERFVEASQLFSDLFVGGNEWVMGDLDLSLLKSKIESIESDLIRIMTVLEMKSISDPDLGRQVGLSKLDRPYFTKKEMAPYVLSFLEQLPAFSSVVQKEIGKKNFSDIVVDSLRPGSKNEYKYEIEYIDIDSSSLRMKAIEIQLPEGLVECIDDFESFISAIRLSKKHILKNGVPIAYIPKMYEPKEGEFLPMWKEWETVDLSDRQYKG